MRTGTTPTYVFKLPEAFTNVSKAKITFRQGNVLVLEKYLSDCTFVNGVIQCPLTQEDTFKFRSDVRAEVQLRIKLADGTTLSSPHYRVHVEGCSDQEVL